MSAYTHQVRYKSNNALATIFQTLHPRWDDKGKVAFKSELENRIVIKWAVLYQPESVIVMKAPKEINTYCPRCRKHQTHRVSLYKKGRERTLAEGARRHEREKKGYGGQKYPLQRKFAKTTKKQTLKLTCKVCGYINHKKGIRLRKLTIE